MKKIFGEGGIKGFVVSHCEKIVFALAVLVVIWIALPDSENGPLNEREKGPDVLKQKATQGTTKMTTTSSWETIYKQRFPVPDNYLVRARADLQRVNPAAYPAPVPLDKPLFPQDKIREDPEIYPPEQPRVVATYGAMAIKDADAGDTRGASGLDDGVRAYPPETREYVDQFGTAGVSPGAKLTSRFVVAVTALAPIRKQTNEFQSVLGETAGFQSARDMQPNYGMFETAEEDAFGRDYYRIERAEVAADGTIGEFVAGWGDPRLAKHKFGTRIANYLQSQWAGGGAAPAAGPNSAGDEFPAARYVDTRFAMNVPPIMLRHLPPLANHPAIPTAAEEKEAEAEPGNTGEEPVFGDPLSGGNTTRPATPTPGSQPAFVRGEEGAFSGGSTLPIEDVEHLLIRFYDIYAEPGKSYVYRIKLFVEDPNFPLDPAARPANRNLSSDVLERLNRRPNKSVWWRESPYSEVSAVVRVPETQKVLAGPVDPGKVARPPNRDFEIRQAERVAKVMALVWDDEEALDVPGIVEAPRGKVVNFTSDTEAIDPSANGLRKITGKKFETGSIVLDIRGGDWFTTKKLHSVPGEILLLDSDGNLTIRSEVEDAKTYNNHNFPEEAELTPDDPLIPGGGGTDPGRPGSGEIDLFGS